MLKNMCLLVFKVINNITTKTRKVYKVCLLCTICDKMEARWKEKGYENICQAIDDPDFDFKYWSEELVNELKYLFRNGYSTSKLSQMTGMQEWKIREKLNLKPKNNFL